MTAIKFPHQQFLENNSEVFATHPLPDMLQKRIQGFESLRQDLEHTTDEDQQQLLSKLEKLSYELDEDLEEYFEPYLENNEEEDNEPETRPLQDQPLHPEVTRQSPFVEQQHDTGSRRSKAGSTEKASPDEKVINRKPSSSGASGQSDEDILAQLVKNRMSFIHPDELFKKGFKSMLGLRTVFVGKFILQRGKYETCYRIGLRGE